MEETETVIGIDFGTKNIVVAVLVDDVAEVLINDVSAHSTPSCAFFKESGEVEIGISALCQAISNPAQVIQNVLMTLGLPHIFLLEGIDHTPEEVITLLFQQCEAVARLHGYSIKKAVITVPQFFDDNQRELLLQSAQIAGFKDLQFIDETVAMAVAYAFKRQTKEREIVVVVHVGGGGGSVCVVEVHHRAVTVLAKSSRKLPGAIDIDELMLQFVVKKIKMDTLCPRSKEILRKACVETKEKLSRHEVITFGPIFLPSLQRDVEFSISRKDFETTCSNLFREISNEILQTLEKAMVTDNQVDKVVGSGGSMRIPALQNIVHKTLKKTLYKGNNLDMDVAKGAVVYGNGIVSVKESKRQQVLVPSNAKVFRPWEMNELTKTESGECKGGDGDRRVNSSERKKMSPNEIENEMGHTNQSGNKAEKEKKEKQKKIKKEIENCEEDEKQGSSESDSDSKGVHQYSIDLEAVFNYKKFSTYPEAMRGGKNKNLRRDFRKQAEPYHYIASSDKLYYIKAARKVSRIWNPDLAKEVVVGRAERLKILKDLHEGTDDSIESKALSGHRGRDKLYAVLDLKYYWNGMYTDVKEYCRNCMTCKMINPLSLKVSDPMHPVPIPARPMAQVGIDLAQLPEVDGLKYICMAICYFTKYSEARALPDKSAAGVARFLYDDVICRHGCPETFISDQGREFCNELMTELFRLTGARQRVTSPYHPQANGLVERHNRTIKNTFLKVLHSKELQWPRILPGVLFAHRSAKHASTGFSPFFLMYRRHPRLPAELAKERGESSSEEDLDDPPPKDFEDEEKQDCDKEMFEEVLRSLCDVDDRINEAAMKNIKRAQERQKYAYDKRHTGGQKLFVGQSVFLKNMRRQERKGGKLVEWPRTGPYTVAQINEEKKLVTLSNQFGKIIKTQYSFTQVEPFNIPKTDRKRKSEVKGPESDFRDEDQKDSRAGKENSKANVEDKSGKSEERSPDGKPLEVPEADFSDEDQKDSRAGKENSKDNVEDKSGKSENSSSEDTDILNSSIEHPDNRCFNPPTKEWKVATCGRLKVTIKDADKVADGISEPKPLGKSSKVHTTAGDGNCYFRALSFILTGAENGHVAIRRKLVAYMKTEEKVARYSGRDKAADYVKDSGMGNLKKWATDIEIYASALWLGIDIYIESAYGNNWQRFSATGALADESSNRHALYMKNTSGNHYDVVIDVE